MLSPLAPSFTFLVANRDLEIEKSRDPNVAYLTAGDIPLKLELRRERRDGIDVYRIRHAEKSELRAEQIKSQWTFPESFNESMTFDAGALQGQPLHLPDGKIPDNHFTNWGSLYYDRANNIAVGTELDGSELSRHARRGYSRFTRTSTLQLMTTTGNPAMAITFFAYRPRDERFWWAEWYQLRSESDPDIPSNFFPILSPGDLSWQPGEAHTVSIIPAPSDRGRKMELVISVDIRPAIVARIPFAYELPVTRVNVPVGEWRSGLYRIVLAPPGASIDPAKVDLNQKLTNVIVRPRSPQRQVLFIAPTDMWYAYSTNGSHDYHGWRTGYDGSVGYSPTVMSSRRHRLNNFYYGLYERYNDIHHFRYLDQLAAQDGFSLDFATQHDVALGRVKLDDYRLVLIGNHCEFTTVESYRRFAEYLGRGGAVMIHGGDSFAVRVEYLPSLAEPRYIWQRGHIWTHLSDQPSDFKAPRLLPEDAAPNAPIINPEAGDAIDYLNVFHVTVGYWNAGDKALVASTTHPVMRGLGFKLGDEIVGPWGGEVDIPYEPRAWDVLIRSDRASPETREFGIDAYDPTPFHRVGLAVHKNLRLGLVSGENFPNILANRESDEYREIYRRTLHYLLDGSPPLDQAANGVEPGRPNGNVIEWDRKLEISALRYELPVTIDFDDPDWHRKPAPYAHYVIEGSQDGESWFRLADRRHGPWRGVQTDRFAPAEVRYIRFDGTLSSGEPFAIRNVVAFNPQ